MTSTWRSCRWGDIATLEYGKALRDYRDGVGEFPVYGTNGPIGWHGSALTDEPGVVVGRKGAYRGIHFSDRPFFVIDTAFYLKPKAGVDPRWAYYELLTKDINGMDTGSAIPSTTRESFYALPVYLPPLDDQRAIAGVLGALDDKIELNRRMNETLDRLIELQFAQLEASAALEWTDASIADLADYVNGRNFTKDASGDGRMVIRIAELNSGRGSSTVFSDADPPDQHIAHEGDILFAWSGSLGVYRWREADALVNQHIFKVIPKAPPWFVYRHLRRAMPRFREIAADKATTMGHIKRGHLAEVKVKLPPAETLSNASSLIEPLDAKIAANERESRTLAELRDALLPKLISGELRVRDVA